MVGGSYHYVTPKKIAGNCGLGWWCSQAFLIIKEGIDNKSTPPFLLSYINTHLQ